MTIVNNTTSAWLRRYHSAPAAPVRLICFPHAGGSASYFHPVSARFSPDVDVIALQYPGRQDRRNEPCVTDLNELAGLVAAELRPLEPRPTVYFGHSMGAALAFETIRRLGDGPRVLIASGRRGPATDRDERVHEKDDAGIIREIGELNGTNSALLADEEVLRMALPSIRGDYQAIETYRCPADRTISAPITVLTGDADPKTTMAEAEEWRAHTTGAFRMRVFAGGHFFLQDQAPAVNAEIATEIETLR